MYAPHSDAHTDIHGDHERQPLLSGTPNGSPTASEHQELGRNQRRQSRNSDDGGDDEDEGDHTGSKVVKEEPSTKKLFIIFASMWLSVTVSAIDSTMVATLAAPIASSFDAATLLSWLATAYLISNAAVQPLTGRLTDIYGRKAGLVLSNVCFASGNLMCGLSGDAAVIIAGRVVAGLGGGGVNAIATFVASDLVPLRRRGLIQGYGNLCYGFGACLGGVLGGVLNDTIGWRWAFLVQVPFIVISGVCCYIFVDIPVKESDRARIKRVDFLGVATLVVSLVLLLLGLNSGGNLVPWTHPIVLTTLPLSLAMLGAFVFVELKLASEPIIPMHLLLDRTVAASCLTNWFGAMGTFAVLFYGPILFQVTGSTATEAGIRLSSISVGIALGSISAGWIMRKSGKYWWLHVAMQLLMVLATLLLATTAGKRIATAPIMIYFLLLGTGYAGMLTITLLALISAVEIKYQAIITSASYAFRSTGSTIGITVASAVFQNLYSARLWAKFGDKKDAAEIIGRIRNDVDHISHLPGSWKSDAVEACLDALQGVWVVTCGIVVLGALCSLFLREQKLYNSLIRD